MMMSIEPAEAEVGADVPQRSGSRRSERHVREAGDERQRQAHSQPWRTLVSIRRIS